MTYDAILASAAQSLERLNVKSVSTNHGCISVFLISLQVETYYLHSPDPATPISETLAAIQHLYEEGMFKHVIFLL